MINMCSALWEQSVCAHDVCMDVTSYILLLEVSLI